MTVRVERRVHVGAPPDEVWAFLAEPDNRARSISVVEDWEEEDEGAVTWHVSIPLPVVDRTIAVRTEDRERRPGEYVRFVGRSPAFRVQGEHELEEGDEGTLVTSRFVVDSSVPGVERYFKRQLDRELDNVERVLRDALEARA